MVPIVEHRLGKQEEEFKPKYQEKKNSFNDRFLLLYNYL
jgi:hypothetical protein